jgi:ribose transport system permease protein
MYGFFVSGMAIWLLQGAWIYVGDKIPFLSNALAPTPFLGLPALFLALLAAFIIGDIFMRISRLGSTLTAVGGNRQAAEIAGINVRRLRTCFVFVSVLWLAGLFVMGQASRTQQDGWPIWVIAIAIIAAAA